MIGCWLNIYIQFIALQTFYSDAPSNHCKTEVMILVFLAVISAVTRASIVAYAASEAI